MMLIEHEIASRHSNAPGSSCPTDRKQGIMRAASVDRSARQVGGLVTTTDVGIDGLIVPASSFDDSYFWNNGSGVRTVYWNHDRNKPIGRCVSLSKRGEDLFAMTFVSRIAAGDDLLTLIEDEAVNGFSTGFRTLEASPINDQERMRWNVTDGDALVIRKALLLEYSFVSMPACGTALIERMLTAGKIQRASAVFLGLDAVGETETRKFYPTCGPAKVEHTFETSFVFDA